MPRSMLFPAKNALCLEGADLLGTTKKTPSPVTLGNQLNLWETSVALERKQIYVFLFFNPSERQATKLLEGSCLSL